MSRTPKFAVGDRVAYSVQWLRSVGMSHTYAARARGEITALKPFSGASLATITWDTPDVPERVLTANLAKVGANTRFASA